MSIGIYVRTKKRSWKLSEKSKINISKGHKGLKHSEETKQKLREYALNHPEHHFVKGQVSPNKGKKASVNVREKMSESQKKAWSEGKYTKKRNEKIRKSMSKLYAEGKLKIGGKKLSEHPNWKGGVSFLYHTERQILMNQSKYKIWREIVFIRDNWTCQECNQRGFILNAHHNKSWRDYPELRFDVNNGVTLCNDCHLEIHKLLRKIKSNREDIGKILRMKYG